MKRNTILTLFVAVIGLSACNTHYYYAPNSLNLTSVQKKGDANVEVGLAGGNQVRGFEARGSYSPWRNVVFTANTMRLSGKFERDPNGGVFPTPTPALPIEKHRAVGYLAEAGGGFYKSVSPFTTLHLLVGTGFGATHHEYGKGRVADLNFSRSYIQPGLTLQGKIADFGCGLRLSMLQYQSGTVDYRIDEGDRTPIERIGLDAPFWMPDFGLSAGLRFSPVRIKCQLTFSLFEDNSAYNFSGNNAFVGLQLDLNELRHKRKKK